MRFSFLIIFLLVTFNSWSQSLINIAGEWRGTLSFLLTTWETKLEVDQQENLVKGYLYTRAPDGSDSAKIRFNGIINGDEVQLEEVAYIYQVGSGCMAMIDLKFSQTGEQRKLEGRWKGDLKWTTCPPGTSGPVRLIQDMSASVPKIVTANKSPEVAVVAKKDKEDGDGLGEVLVRELSKRKYYGLIIAIDQYEDERIQTLDNPIMDATALYNVLVHQYSFKKELVTMLQNPDRAAIVDAMDGLAQQVEETDNVLIFYAGHGIWNEQLNQGYWLPGDANLDSKSFWLSNSTIRDYLGGIKSKHTLLISDACFSGGIFKERGITESSKAVLELYKLPSRKAMTSGTMTTVPDKSVFIEYLIKNLKNNEAEFLSADQLFQSFKLAVIHNSPSGQVPQYGAISFVGDEGGDFIFLRKE